MRILRIFSLTAALAMMTGATGLRAQLPGGGKTALNTAMLKLFGEVTNFTSKADIRMVEKDTREPMSMSVEFAMLDGRARMDLDMMTLKSRQLPAEALASFKAAGLDKLATIVRPDRKVLLLVYPAIRSYAEVPMSKEEAADMDRKYRVEKTRLGRETIGGQPCDKMKAVVTADSGEKHEALVWCAAALKNFPLKMQMDQQSATVVMDYRDVKLVRPDPKLFEAPSGFTKYGTVEQLMQNAMMKMLGGGGPKR
jgi:hypothetical protein